MERDSFNGSGALKPYVIVVGEDARKRFVDPFAEKGKSTGQTRDLAPRSLRNTRARGTR
jgi:hypothetical protein